jgi:superfamily II DNA or RNA helicase
MHEQAPLLQRPYQVAAIDAVQDAWEAGHRRALLVMATGTGKTYTFGRILVQRRDQGYGRALVFAHRIELVDQAVAALVRAGLTVEVESGDRLATPHGTLLAGPSDVVVATVQTMRGRRLERWPETAFGTVVVDEAHRLNRFSGLYGNQGENQVKEIINASHLSVFFLECNLLE